MISKSDRFYFENLTAAAEVSHTAATYLVSCLSEYDPERIQAMLDTMHHYEHMGDTKKHEMSEALAKAFVTPVDREDLGIISQNIDEVTDRIEEVLQLLYVDKIQSITPSAIEFAEKLVECCTLMKNVIAEFIHFKKPEKLYKLIVELNNLEETCDWLYLQAKMHTSEQFDNVLDILYWREIYEKMEKCADACEDVSDHIALVVMKNT